MSKKDRSNPEKQRNVQTPTPLRIWWDRGEAFGRSYVRRIEFCCPAMSANWNRVTQLTSHPETGRLEVVWRAQLSAAILQASATEHAAAIAAEEATGIWGEVDEQEVNWNDVPPHICCAHCGGQIVIEMIDAATEEVASS